MCVSVGAILDILIHRRFTQSVLKKIDKKMIQELNYQGVDFPVSLKDYNKIEEQNNININVFQDMRINSFIRFMYPNTKMRIY